MFPQGLIDQWLSKTRDGRRSVRDDPKATPAILENIDRLEEYCLDHPYDVFCASALQNPPFSLYALESVEAEQQRLARPPLVFAAAAPSPREGTAEREALCCGMSGRYAEAEDARASAAAAAQHLHRVVTRLAAYLHSSDAESRAALLEAGHGDGDGGARRMAVADLFVRLLSEAAVAAAYREGTAAQVEAEERAAFTHRRRGRRLQLRAAAAAAAAPESLSGDEADGAEDLVVVRPIADYRRWSQGLASLWGLLAPTEPGGEAGNGGETTPPHKRSRDHTADAEGVEGGGNLWTRVRLDALRNRLGDRVLPPPPASTSAVADAQHGVAAPATANTWATRQLRITARDVQFALRHVLAADPPAGSPTAATP
ncbi:hypothetical protein NESM_000703600 [Novymonas esmeraldas]|uniref:Uncharacterized protein n=1 Tax=Novymonas esmeraldas TaxID=1808958 RepID=A0AAW0EXM0_9TRYP